MRMKVSQKQQPPSQDWRKVTLFPSGRQGLGHKDSHKHREDKQADRTAKEECGVTDELQGWS